MEIKRKGIYVTEDSLVFVRMIKSFNGGMTLIALETLLTLVPTI